MGPEANIWKYFHLQTSLEGEVKIANNTSTQGTGALSTPTMSPVHSSPVPVKVRAISDPLIAYVFDMIRL